MTLAPLLAVVLWGGMYPAIKVGLTEIPTLAFIALRMVVASAVLFAAARAAAPPARPLDRPVRRLVLRVGLAQTAFQLLLVGGLARTSASHSAILLATAPLLAAAWAVAAGGARFGAKSWSGLAMGLAGVVLVVGGSDAGDAGGPGASRLAGDLLSLASAAVWAAYSFAIAPLVSARGAMRATGAGMLVAAVVLVPVALPEMSRIAWSQLSVPAWVGFLYSCTGGTVAAMALWAWSVAHHGVARTMPWAYLEPVSAVLLAAAILGESLGWVQALGAAVALTGVWLASGRGGGGT